MENLLNSTSSQEPITFPRLESLAPHQRQVLFSDPETRKVLVWHRRARKTTTAINQIVKWTQLKVGVYWHVFPTYGEAKDAVWRDPQMLFDIVPEELIARKNESELIIYFKNGSIYQLKGADNPETLRGANPYGIILDEFATMKRETWDIVEPILTANGGWCWFIGTPKGRNHLFEFYQRGQAGIANWKSYLLKASTSGIIDRDALVAARQTALPAMWNQEYECEFLEGEGSVFRGVKDVMVAEPQQPIPTHLYVMGVDLAKSQDWTVIRVYDRETNALCYTQRFQQLEWPFQKAKIKAVADHFNKALVSIDATGLGDPIADDLLRAGVAVIPVKITEPIKKELIEKLSIWIEQKRMKLLREEWDKYGLFEYENFSYTIGPTGRIRYEARQGFHDDVVLADALAIYQLQPLGRDENMKDPTPTQIAYVRARQKYDEQYNNESGDGFDQWETPTEDIY